MDATKQMLHLITLIGQAYRTCNNQGYGVTNYHVYTIEERFEYVDKAKKAAEEIYYDRKLFKTPYISFILQMMKELDREHERLMEEWTRQMLARAKQS